MVYTEKQQQEHIEEILGLLYRIALHDSRIPIVLPAKEFTEEDALAVRAYQEAYGLPVTGEIDGDTWDSIVNTYHSLTDYAVSLEVFPAGEFLLREGDGNDLVRLVQLLLNFAAARYGNLPAVTVSGTYDAETAAAVAALQQIAALPVTGEMDRHTWDRLASLVNRLPLDV